VRTSWASFAAVPLIVGGLAFSQAWQAALALPGAWWAFPVAASSISVAALAISAISAVSAISVVPKRSGGSISTGAYLIPGPAMAALFVLPGVAPVPAAPAWAADLMPGLFLLSALLFYAVTREPEEDEGRPAEPLRTAPD